MLSGLAYLNQWKRGSAIQILAKCLLCHSGNRSRSLILNLAVFKETQSKRKVLRIGTPLETYDSANNHDEMKQRWGNRNSITNDNALDNERQTL